MTPLVLHAALLLIVHKVDRIYKVYKVTKCTNEQAGWYVEAYSMTESIHVTKSTEWYTPPKYIEAARSVMGSIELDPASCAAANLIVKAERYYTKEQNGLDQEWAARSLWLNPPYGRTAKMQATRKSTIGLFIEKLLHSYEQGKVEQAVALVTTEVNAKWFYPLWQFPICIPDHRVTFLVPHKTANNYKQMFGTCFVYLGPSEQKFVDTFSQFGIIVKHVSPIQPKYTTRQLWEHVESDGNVA